VDDRTIRRDLSGAANAASENTPEATGADGKTYPARQRTEAERQELAERAQKMQAEGASYHEIATSLGVSVGTAYDLVRKPRPAVFARNAREHERVADLLHQVEPEALGDDLLDAKRAVKKARAVVCERQRQEMARAVAQIAIDDRWQVWQADIRTWQAPRQYDFIITDPPYPREYLSLYETLAERAAEWLAPGGLLVVMVGQSYLDEIIAMMTRHVDYYWTACYLLPEQPTPLRRRAVNTSWKPLLMFVRKGDEYRGKIFGDVFASPKPAKDNHEWEQSVGGMLSIVAQLALPGQFILDPFVGSGTTGVAALMHGCLFHGVDIDADAVAITRKRLSEAVGCSDECNDA
jgi:site-specific DNA-methyltransferase (adenine-specific)